MRYRLRTLLIVALFAALFIGLPLYVLSVGPLIYLQSSGRINYEPNSPLGRAYLPLRWAQNGCPPLKRFMNWYGFMWLGPPPPGTRWIKLTEGVGVEPIKPPAHNRP